MKIVTEALRRILVIEDDAETAKRDEPSHKRGRFGGGLVTAEPLVEMRALVRN